MRILISRIVTLQRLLRPSAAGIVANLLAALLATGPAGAQAPLSLDEALTLAETRSPQLAGAEYAATAARERGIASSQLPDPVLRLGLDNVPVTGPDAYSLTTDFMTMRRIGVMQEFTELRQARSASANAAMSKPTASWRSATPRARCCGRRSRWRGSTSISRQRIAELWRALRAEVRLQTTTLEAGVATGRTNAADVRAAQAVVVQTEDQIAASEQQARISAMMLSRWLGAIAAARPARCRTWRQSTTTRKKPPRWPRMPQLAVLHQDNAARRNGPEARERAARHPTGASKSPTSSVARRTPTWFRSASTSRCRCFPANARIAASRQARRSSRRPDALFQDTLRQHQAELRAEFEEWRSLQRRAQALQRTLLPLADDRVAQTLASYAGGTATLAQVLEARRAAVDARMQVLLLERDAARAWAKINFQSRRRIEPCASIRRQAMNRTNDVDRSRCAGVARRRRHRLLGRASAGRMRSRRPRRHRCNARRRDNRTGRGRRRRAHGCCTGTTRWCPDRKFDKPGKSPFMDMELVPVYADEAAGEGVAVSSAMTSSLGIRTAVVRKIAVGVTHRRHRQRRRKRARQRRRAGAGRRATSRSCTRAPISIPLPPARRSR